jgi:diphthine synthase
MGELWFVGLGLDDAPGLDGALGALLDGAGAVFFDGYTSALAPAVLEALERRCGARWRSLDRAAAEEGSEVLAALTRSDRVLFLVPGDPFVATTHVALRLRAEEAGHRWKYRPGASVLSAVPSFLGLQHYRFGRTVSVPFPAPGFAPRSFLDRIGENRRAGLHSLVLLDLDPARGRYLSAGEALEILAQRDTAPRVLPPELGLAVAARVGRADASAWYAPSELLRPLPFGAPPHALVVPAPELHFEEAAALERFRPLPR